MSSPRERGSSLDAADDAGRGRVVPARAGVILLEPNPNLPDCRRPRASGGHPLRSRRPFAPRPSSPRERGSSLTPSGAPGTMSVVPARAGVIRGARGGSTETTSRPRASGGHPGRQKHGQVMTGSSPRERGSSRGEQDIGPREPVVPARAGVIRAGDLGSRRGRRRPRASGGHPTSAGDNVRQSWSSPRERGSSALRAEYDALTAVVPARAGVILGTPCVSLRNGGRPRASGGHPGSRTVPPGGVTSSPRERGSSRPATCGAV